MAADRCAKPGFIFSLHTCMNEIQSTGEGRQMSVIFAISYTLLDDFWSDEKGFEAG